MSAVGLITLCAAVFTFLLPPAPAAAQVRAPSLDAPADGATATSLRPTISWRPVTGANQYAAEIADNPQFFGRMSSGWINLTRFTPSSDLRPNTLYFWRVKATGQGGASEDSAVRRLWMPLTVTSPADNAAASQTPTLEWTAYKTGAVNDPDRAYRVQIAEEANFAGALSVDETTTTTAYTVPFGSLIGGKTYYWRVNVSNPEGTSGWSTVRSFTTVVAITDGATLIAPAAGEALDTYYPTATWEPVAAATRYIVRYVVTRADGSQSPERASGELTATSFRFNPFFGGDATADNAAYEWWVEARNLSGSAASAHSTFRLPGRQAPSEPSLVGPDDGSTVSSLTPRFEWTGTTYTKTYRFELGAAVNGTSVAERLAGPTFPTSPGTPESFFVYEPDGESVYPLQYETTYYWQVTALSVGGIGTKSPIRSFTTPARPV